MITVDYYSQYFELDKPTRTTSHAMIQKLKESFVRHGIPETLIFDNGPQNASAVLWLLGDEGLYLIQLVNRRRLSRSYGQDPLHQTLRCLLKQKVKSNIHEHQAN